MADEKTSFSCSCVQAACDSKANCVPVGSPAFDLSVVVCPPEILCS